MADPAHRSIEPFQAASHRRLDDAEEGPGTADGRALPVLRPLLPDADRLLPYLRRIDRARIYSNWGPLTTELETRLDAMLGLHRRSVVSASSGTAALTGAVLATAGRARAERPLALIPAFTFVATAIAVEACGYQPYLVDVGADRLALDADRLRTHPALPRTGLVVPVAPFGRGVEQQPWASFRHETGIPVVIDGAASLESLAAQPAPFLGDVPVSLSFHATKAFATGEGGAVVTTASDLREQVTQALNFGFYEQRESRSASINGKMSEYHAAVGLAELDGWPAKQRAFHALADRYRQRGAAHGLAQQLTVAPEIAGCYAIFRCRDAGDSRRVQSALRQRKIGFRLWYGLGLHAQPHFRDLPHDDLSVTERISPLLIGLPVAVDLSDEAIERTVAALTESGTSRDPGPPIP